MALNLFLALEASYRRLVCSFVFRNQISVNHAVFSFLFFFLVRKRGWGVFTTTLTHLGVPSLLICTVHQLSSVFSRPPQKQFHYSLLPIFDGFPLFVFGRGRRSADGRTEYIGVELFSRLSTLQSSQRLARSCWAALPKAERPSAEAANAASS